MNSELISGDTLDFIDAPPRDPDYLPADGWLLTYVLTPRFTAPVQATITLPSIVEGENFRIQASAATTSGWIPGAYNWFRYVARNGIRQSVGMGALQVLPNPSTVAAGFDARSDARAIYEGLLALWRSHSAGQGLAVSYQIAGRAMAFKTSGDLLRELTYWKAQVEAEEIEERLAAGLDSGRKIYYGFTL